MWDASGLLLDELCSGAFFLLALFPEFFGDFGGEERGRKLGDRDAEVGFVRNWVWGEGGV